MDIYSTSIALYRFEANTTRETRLRAGGFRIVDTVSWILVRRRYLQLKAVIRTEVITAVFLKDTLDAANNDAEYFGRKRMFGVNTS